MLVDDDGRGRAWVSKTIKDDADAVTRSTFAMWPEWRCQYFRHWRGGTWPGFSLDRSYDELLGEFMLWFSGFIDGVGQTDPHALVLTGDPWARTTDPIIVQHPVISRLIIEGEVYFAARAADLDFGSYSDYWHYPVCYLATTLIVRGCDQASLETMSPKQIAGLVNCAIVRANNEESGVLCRPVTM